MALKGDLKLEIDEQGIEARITITPDENGADISTESLERRASEAGASAGPVPAQSPASALLADAPGRRRSRP